MSSPEETDAAASPLPAGYDSPTLRIPVRVELAEEKDGSERTTHRLAPAPAGGGAPPGSRAAAPPEPHPRRGAGRYTILDEIGRGGMGVVHRAFDRDLRRHVAMKVMLKEVAVEQDLAARFVEEAQATAQLQHPGIVPVYEIGLIPPEPGGTHGKLFFTMKLVRGRTLTKVVEDIRAGDPETTREFTLFRLLQTMIEVARAVSFAHDRGVVHRDLKPQNVMLGRHGEVHVMDWGLAKVLAAARGAPGEGAAAPAAGAESQVAVQPASGVLAAGRSDTLAGTVIGTPAYMPPEQAEGDPGLIGPHSDIYALGATLYHVLTGRAPFEARSTKEMIAKILTVEPPRPRAVEPAVPRELEAICLKAMAKDPKARYASAKELAEDLQAVLEDRPVRALREGLLRRARRGARRHRVLVTAALALAIAAAFGLGAVSAAARREREALVERARADAKLAREALERGRREHLAGLAPEDYRRRVDELLGLGLDALQATAQLTALVPDDESARKDAYAAAIAIGRVALQAEQWNLAASAFKKARDLGVDEIGAGQALAEVERERARVQGREGAEVRRWLDAARSGTLTAEVGGYEDALAGLLMLRSAPAVALLAEALNEATAALREGARGRGARGASPEQLLLARLCCEALGRMGMREGAVGPLGAYLEAEADEQRAAVAAEALCRVGGKEADSAVGAAILRYGMNGPLHARVAPFLGRRAADAGGAEPADAEQYRQRGVARRSRGDLDGAIADFTRAAELAPPNALALVGRSKARRLQGDFAGAVVDASKALAATDDRSGQPRLEAWIARAEARIDAGEPEAAEADLAAVRKLFSSYWTRPAAQIAAQVSHLSGRARLARGDLDGAIAEQAAAIEKQPRFIAAWKARAEARARRGDLEDAVADFSRAIDLDPRDRTALDGRAAARLKMGDVDGAIADASRAIDLEPGRARAWALRARSRSERGDLEAAVADASRALELDPKDAATWALRGGARRLTGDAEGALADLSRAIEVDPRLGDALAARARLLGEMGARERAIDDWTRAIDLSPGDAGLLGERGAARQARGDLEGALADLSRAVELEPRGAAAWERRGQVRREKGDLDGAIADLTRALEIDRRRGGALAQRGLAHLAKGERDAAIADLSRAVELSPRDAGALAGRADARLGKGDAEGAAADAGLAIEIDPRAALPWLVRGLARARKGEGAGAAADLEQAIGLGLGPADLDRARKALLEAKQRP